MADIYSKSGKMEEAEKMFKILVKKFCRVKEVWIRWVVGEGQGCLEQVG